jgi:hypothetical protein
MCRIESLLAEHIVSLRELPAFQLKQDAVQPAVAAATTAVSSSATDTREALTHDKSFAENTAVVDVQVPDDDDFALRPVILRAFDYVQVI